MGEVLDPLKELAETAEKLRELQSVAVKAANALTAKDSDLAVGILSKAILGFPGGSITTDGAPDKWDHHFLTLALACAKMSKDPSTIVGAVIVGPDREIRSTGFNGFPRGIADSAERLADRDLKLKLVVHAECNAICNAARVGVSLKGCTLYLAASDQSGAVWGGAPCTRCTVHVIQAGITKVVTYPPKQVPSRWHEDIAAAKALLIEAGIEYVEMGGPHGT